MMILCSIQAFLFNGISIGKFSNVQSTFMNSRYVNLCVKDALFCFLYASHLCLGCNVTILHLWGQKSTSLLLGMHVLYTIGGFTVPLLSEPFMTSRQDCPILNASISSPCFHHNESAITVDLNINSTSESLSPGTLTSEEQKTVLCGQFTSPDSIASNFPETRSLRCDSKIKYVYLIIGLYAGIVAVLNGITYWKIPVKLEIFKGSKRSENLRKATQSLTVLTYILFIMFNFCFGGQEMTFSGLLFTYATEHVGLSTIEGSLLVSALFACYWNWSSWWNGCCEVYQSSRSATCGHSLRLCSCIFLGLFHSKRAQGHFWVCTIVGGLALSTVFCSALIWAREFVPVGGRFTSIYVIAYTTGMMTWPPLTGFLVRERGPQWFPYINLLLVIGCAIFYSCLIGLRLAYKTQLTRAVLNPSVPSNVHLQINRKLLFTSFHGSLPQLQTDLKMM